jgi:nitroreductase
MELLNKLQWRYAAKKMDPAQVVPQDKVDRIVEAARLAPTSSGLQPFEVFVITNPELRARIREIAWNQAQITDGSHLLVFAAWDDYTAERINHMWTAPRWKALTRPSSMKFWICVRVACAALPSCRWATAKKRAIGW